MVTVVFVYTVLCPESSDTVLSPDPSFTSKAAVLVELGYLESDTAFMSTQLKLMIPECKIVANIFILHFSFAIVGYFFLFVLLTFSDLRNVVRAAAGLPRFQCRQ